MQKLTLVNFCSSKYKAISRQNLRTGFILLFLSGIFLPVFAQEHEAAHELTETDTRALAENLWAIASNKIEEKSGIPDQEKESFYAYAAEQENRAKILFFLHAFKGLLTEKNLDNYIENRISARKRIYQQYLKEGKKKKTSTPPRFRLKSDAPCHNMGFETGTFDEWEGAIRDRHVGNQAFPVVANPGQWQQDFLQHCIMTPEMKDPLIPDLPVVYPGRTHSVRLGNTIGGGHIATMRRTFTVDSSNMVFTYRYAVVLDDPAGARGHDNLHRPHFYSRLLSANGEEIGCTGYSVVVEPNLPDYNRTCIAMDWAMEEANIGCPPENINDGAAHYTPNRRNGCTGNNLDIYYKDWSTVSMVLDNFLGQEITIEFTAADCVPGAHLGYAYIDAECAPLNLSQSLPICSGVETGNITAPEGFASYSWSGPGIVSGDDKQEVTINRSGTYTVTVIPFSDTPCPTELTYVVEEKCPDREYSETLCETLPNTLEAENVNLKQYEDLVTENGVYGTIESWYTELPEGLVRINNPEAFTIKHEDTLYAVSSFENIRNDTVLLIWQINNLPEIDFPEQDALCEGAPAVQLQNITPSGGTFIGNHITTSGLFNPEEAGTFEISYTFTNENGCTDTVSNFVQVIAPPSVDAGSDQTICATETEVELTGELLQAAMLQWSGSGTFSPGESSATPVYKPSEEDITNGLAELVLTASGYSPCPSVTDTVRIFILPEPKVDAGEDQVLCSDTEIINLEGLAENQQSVEWTGGAGTFSSPTNLSTTYEPTSAEKQSESLILTLTVISDNLCEPATDQVEIFFINPPQVDAGPDQIVCASQTEVNLLGSASYYTEVQWNGSGSFSPQSANQLSSTYFISDEDYHQEYAELYLVAEGNSPCPSLIDTILISITPQPKVDAGEDQVLCSDTEIINLEGIAENQQSVEWAGGAGSFSAPNNSNTTYEPTAVETENESLIFTLTITGENVCEPVSDQVEIRFVQPPIADAGPDTTVCANNARIELKGVISEASGSVWSGGNGTFNPSANNVITSYTPSESEIATGLVTLTLSTTGSEICPDVSDQKQITIYPAPTADAGPPIQVCADEKAISLSGSSTHASEVTWSGGTGSFEPSVKEHNTVYTLSPEDINRGNISLSFTAQEEGCLPISDETIITIQQLPVLQTPDVATCEGKPAVLTTSEIQGATYVWSTSERQLSSSNHYVEVIAEPGELTYYVAVETPEGCSETDSMTLSGVPLPLISLPDTAVCLNEEVTLWVELQNESELASYPITFQWTYNNQVISSDRNYSFVATESFNPEVTVSNGCPSKTLAKVVVNPLPEGNLNSEYKICRDTEEYQILDPGASFAYEWHYNGDTVRTITVREPGDYQVTLFNEHNCSATIGTHVREVCPPSLHISSAFSPNSDGTNDMYTVYHKNVTNYQMLIFNRWGEIIFESQNPDEAWDGYYRQELMPVGVYPWTITYEGNAEEYKGPYKKKGSVTLIR